MTILLILAGLGLVAAACVRVVGPDEVLVLRRPGRTRVAGPGPTWVLPLVESVTRVPTTDWHVVATTTATTSDGIVTRMQAEAALRYADAAAVEPGTHAATLDALEASLAAYVAANRLPNLPDVGDLLDLQPDLPPGPELVRMIVVGCDVEVTPELRRLVSGR